jgi:hypothetical protein
MTKWLLHEQMASNPPSERMRDVHMLHHTQSMTKMPQLSVGADGRAGRRDTSRTTETITVEDYVAFFHQYFGFTNNPFLAPFENEQSRCKRY